MNKKNKDKKDVKEEENNSSSDLNDKNENVDDEVEKDSDVEESEEETEEEVDDDDEDEEEEEEDDDDEDDEDDDDDEEDDDLEEEDEEEEEVDDADSKKEKAAIEAVEEKVPAAVTEAEPSAPLNAKAATLVCVILAGLAVLAAKTFSDQGILLIAGIFVFLGAYPAIKLDVKDATKKFSIEMVLIFALCMVLFVILRTLFPDSEGDGDYAKIVIIILTIMAVRLIVWPIYTFED